MSGTRWLDGEEQRTWRAFLAASTLLFDQLDRELQRNSGIPHAYYEILVRLSEADGRAMRMSELARNSLSSRSRHLPEVLDRPGGMAHPRARFFWSATAGDSGGPFAGTFVLPGSGSASNGQCTQHQHQNGGGDCSRWHLPVGSCIYAGRFSRAGRKSLV